MNDLQWYWVYIPYLDQPERQHEPAVQAGYDKVYLKSEADKVIAEKDAKILALDAEVFKQRYHAKLFFDERNYAESQLRATKHALWMARKAHAVAMVAYWDSHYRDNPNAVYRNRTIDWLRNRWLLILDCCIKKEKEYK